MSNNSGLALLSIIGGGYALGIIVIGIQAVFYEPTFKAWTPPPMPTAGEPSRSERPQIHHVYIKGRLP